MENGAESEQQKPLTYPVFQSAIPSHLLGKLSEQERYIVETLSKMEQQNTWLSQRCVEDSNMLMGMERRLSRVEKWKAVLMGRWAFVIGIVAVAAPIVLSKILEIYVFKKP